MAAIHSHEQGTRRNFLIGLGTAGTALSVSGCTGLLGDEADDDIADDTDDVDPVELGEEVEEITLLSIAEGDAPARFEYGRLVADDFRELGFEVDYDPQPVSEYLTARAEPPYPWDAQVRRAGDGFEPAEAIFRSFFHSANIGPGNSNLYAYDNPEMDGLIDEQARTMDPDARTEIIHDIQRLHREDMPVVPLLVQERVMPYDSDKFQNPAPIIEEGLGGFWNFHQIEPVTDDAHLRTTMPEDIFSLTPLDQTPRSRREMLRLLYDPLMRITTDVEVVPWAAESVETVDDTTVDITIRDDMQFHDGEPVTVDDVEFSFTWPAEVSPTKETRLAPIDEVEVHNDTDLTFHLVEPNAPFFTEVLARNYILPQHIWEDIEDEIDVPPVDWPNPEPVGSGPFQALSVDFDDQIQLEAFDDHFSPPNVDQVTRAVVADLPSAIRAYEDEALDQISWELPIDDIPRFEEDPRTSLIEVVMMSIHHIGYNLRQAPFDDRQARLAGAHAVPQEIIIDTIYGGTGDAIHNPISSGFPEWYWGDVEEYVSDVDVGRQVLEDAGYGWDDDGRLHYPV